MAHPIKELTKLTCRAKQIDGMGFGGGAAVDNLEVAAILGMKHQVTGKKLARQPYCLARYAYCADEAYRVFVRSALLHELLHIDTGKIAEDTLLRMVNAAIKEFMNPQTKINQQGAQEIISYSDNKVASTMGINHKNLTQTHKVIYNKLVEKINVWSSEAIEHIKSHSYVINE